MIENKTKNQKGFTLLELIISISMMMILTSILLVNFGTISKNGHFNTTVDTLISNLHKSQSLSISSRDVAGTPSSAYGLEFVAGNTAVSYNLFIEDNKGVRRNSNISSFPQGIYISSIEVLTQGASGDVIANPSNITTRFTVPYGRVTQSYTGASNQQDTQVTLNLTTADGSKTRKVIINGITGNISVQ
jgi:prepilin-type N-terminal cleavage/methylation domain-containing protein